MFWLQAGIAFVIWVAYGAFLARRIPRLRAFTARIPRGQRAAMGAACLLLSVAQLFGVLLLVMSQRAVAPSGFVLWAWFAVAASGLALVHLQTVGTALLVALGTGEVTQVKDSASRPSEGHVHPK